MSLEMFIGIIEFTVAKIRYFNASLTGTILQLPYYKTFYGVRGPFYWIL